VHHNPGARRAGINIYRHGPHPAIPVLLAAPPLNPLPPSSSKNSQAPTQWPTVSPSASPSAPPTAAPTPAPTQPPTDAPTTGPTSTPSEVSHSL
jgi:hypothetical protein